MKKQCVFFLFLTVLLVNVCFAATLEDIRRRVGKSDVSEQSDSGSKKVVQIQSVNKGVVSGWVFSEGTGTRMVRSMDVKFKIRKKGQVELSYLCCYLFDKNKKEVKKLTEFLELVPSGSQEPVSNKVFNGGKTTTVQFVYPNEISFKYCIAVVGNDADGVSYFITPRAANVNEFEFAERKLIVKEAKEKPAASSVKKSE